MGTAGIQRRANAIRFCGGYARKDQHAVAVLSWSGFCFRCARGTGSSALWSLVEANQPAHSFSAEGRRGIARRAFGRSLFPSALRCSHDRTHLRAPVAGTALPFALAVAREGDRESDRAGALGVMPCATAASGSGIAFALVQPAHLIAHVVFSGAAKYRTCGSGGAAGKYARKAFGDRALFDVPQSSRRVGE